MFLRCCYTTIYSVTTQIEKIKTFLVSTVIFCLFTQHLDTTLAVHVIWSQLAVTRAQVSICHKRLLWSSHDQPLLPLR